MKSAPLEEALRASGLAPLGGGDGAPAPAAPKSLYGSAFDSANWSQDRGQIWLPTVDSEKEVDTTSRIELLRLSRWFRDNIAPYRNVVENVPALITGAKGLQPFPTTTDKEWNALALSAFRRRAMSAEAFDLGGQWSFYGAQNAALSHEFLDGDFFGALTESPARAAMMQFYEAHQCCSKTDAGPEWYDGIRCDRHGKTLAARIVSKETSMDIARENLIHFVDDRRRGARRGLPCGYHWFNDGRDWNEYKRFAKLAVKNSARVAYFRRKQGKNAPTDLEMGSLLDVGTDDAPDLKKVINVEDMSSQAPNLGDDTLEILHDDRPHPNVLAFQSELVYQLATGLGLHPSVVAFFTGLGGTEVRLVLQGMKPWIARRQQRLVETMVSRFYIYSTGRDMERGILPQCQDPEWYKHGVICPADMTVDVGREGNLKVNLLSHRMLTLQIWAGELGQWWEDFQDQTIREAARGARRLREISAEEDVTVSETVAYMNEFRPASLGSEDGNDDTDDNNDNQNTGGPNDDPNA